MVEDATDVLIFFLTVSVLAFKEYNKLQEKYELESQCRSEAEKFAAEVHYG